ncbi:subtilisin-like protein [Mayamaea pseudoterrestris]|nr:subtilisin-like protein [Mayamaea pseudoterrestris]GKY98050.1 subtilisin-like protein [Mayamaea pseudoterrestris]
MTMRIPCIILLLATIVASDKTGGFTFTRGSLGQVSDTNVAANGALPAATSTLASILRTSLGATGREDFRVSKRKNKLVKDVKGHQHVRFQQTYQNVSVVDAAMVMHLDKRGKVYAVNGEFVMEGSVDTKVRVSCEDAFADTLTDPNYGSDAVWLTECDVKIVFDQYGDAHKAWQRMIGYMPIEGPYQKTFLYASVVTGDIVAVRPQVHGALSLRTENCLNADRTDNCRVVSTSSRRLATSDPVVNDAHNFAISTWEFYKKHFGRDSIDDNGMTLISHVHYSTNYNNAFWDTTSMTYGDGDGNVLGPLSRGIDVVGHELSHGVTQWTSGLVYQAESGALNEAFSDIMGACVDRENGANIANTWMIGEKVYTPSVPGDAFRYMTNPTQGDSGVDWYPDRYQGTSDAGGVHWNSGIMNLAFTLMVQGGKHPRGKSNVVVPPIDQDFDTSLIIAAKIFYMANTACLTPLSGFYEIRECTMLHAGNHVKSVEAAWQAVGLVTLYTNTPITGINAVKGQLLQYGIAGVPYGTTVSCSLNGDNGDADLYLTMQSIRNYDRSASCSSLGQYSTEACTVGSFQGDVTKVWITVYAYTAFTNLSLTCTKTSTWTPLANGVAQTGLAASPGYANLFILPSIPPLTAVSCKVTTQTGVPTLYGSLMTDDGDINEYDPCSVAGSEFVRGSALCIFNSPQKATTNLYFGVYAVGQAFSGLSLTCSLQPIKVNPLSNWVYYTDTAFQVDTVGKNDRINLYSLDTVIDQGKQATCVMKASENIVAELQVYYGSVPNAGMAPELACTGVKECTSSLADGSAGVYAQVTTQPFSTLSTAISTDIICGQEPTPIAITNKIIQTGISGIAGGDTALQVFRLDGVITGEKVACSISGGADGDADLYVQIGSTPHPLADKYSCVSGGPSSTEACTTEALVSDSSVFVSIHTYASFTNLSLVCSRISTPSCKPLGAACMRIKQCCGSNTNCDGTTDTNKVCVKAVSPGGRCVRKTQCLQGYTCRRNVCVMRTRRRRRRRRIVDL